MTTYDITIPVREGLAVWPGDTPYTFALGWKMSEGASVNVSTTSGRSWKAQACIPRRNGQGSKCFG